MRIYLSCMKCQPPTGLSVARLEDSGLYYMTCPQGHQTVTCLQQMKFEVLFDLAAHAIVDGYHREAVTSFTSALERFFEFYIDVTAERHGVAREGFDGAWRHISKQSERQLGAFTWAYLMQEGRAPTLLSKREVEFRNQVIHQGKIPSRDEAVSYGESVAAIILPILQQLRTSAGEVVDRAVFRHVRRLHEQVKGSSVSVMTTVTMISLNRPTTESQPSLKDWLTKLVHLRTMRPPVVG